MDDNLSNPESSPFTPSLALRDRRIAEIENGGIEINGNRIQSLTQLLNLVNSELYENDELVSE